MFQKKVFALVRVNQLVKGSSCKQKGHGFDPFQGTCLDWVQFLVRLYTKGY